MTFPAARTLPPHLTLAEARRIVTDPQQAAGTPMLLRHHAWAIVKAANATRKARLTLILTPPGSGPGQPTPGDAA